MEPCRPGGSAGNAPVRVSLRADDSGAPAAELDAAVHAEGTGLPDGACEPLWAMGEALARGESGVCVIVGESHALTEELLTGASADGPGARGAVEAIAEGFEASRGSKDVGLALSWLRVRGPGDAPLRDALKEAARVDERAAEVAWSIDAQRLSETGAWAVAAPGAADVGEMLRAAASAPPLRAVRSAEPGSHDVVRIQADVGAGPGSHGDTAATAVTCPSVTVVRLAPTLEPEPAGSGGKQVPSWAAALHAVMLAVEAWQATVAPRGPDGEGAGAAAAGDGAAAEEAAADASEVVGDAAASHAAVAVLALPATDASVGAVMLTSVALPGSEECAGVRACSASLRFAGRWRRSMTAWRARLAAGGAAAAGVAVAATGGGDAGGGRGGSGESPAPSGYRSDAASARSPSASRGDAAGGGAGGGDEIDPVTPLWPLSPSSSDAPAGPSEAPADAPGSRPEEHQILRPSGARPSRAALRPLSVGPADTPDAQAAAAAAAAAAPASPAAWQAPPSPGLAALGQSPSMRQSYPDSPHGPSDRTRPGKAADPVGAAGRAAAPLVTQRQQQQQQQQRQQQQQQQGRREPAAASLTPRRSDAQSPQASDRMRRRGGALSYSPRVRPLRPSPAGSPDPADTPGRGLGHFGGSATPVTPQRGATAVPAMAEPAPAPGQQQQQQQRQQQQRQPSGHPGGAAPAGGLSGALLSEGGRGGRRASAGSGSSGRADDGGGLSGFGSGGFAARGGGGRRGGVAGRGGSAADTGGGAAGGERSEEHAGGSAQGWGLGRGGAHTGGSSSWAGGLGFGDVSAGGTSALPPAARLARQLAQEVECRAEAEERAAAAEARAEDLLSRATEAEADAAEAADAVASRAGAAEAEMAALRSEVLRLGRALRAKALALVDARRHAEVVEAAVERLRSQAEEAAAEAERWKQEAAAAGARAARERAATGRVRQALMAERAGREAAEARATRLEASLGVLQREADAAWTAPADGAGATLHGGRASAGAGAESRGWTAGTPLRGRPTHARQRAQSRAGATRAADGGGQRTPHPGGYAAPRSAAGFRESRAGAAGRAEPPRPQSARKQAADPLLEALGLDPEGERPDGKW